MKSNPLVTIYVPCRNYGKYLSKCINSVINQVYESWELIIINEGSSDNTSELAIRFEKKYVIQRLGIPLYRYRRHDKNITNHNKEMESYYDALKLKHSSSFMKTE